MIRQVTGRTDIEAVASLANAIWREHYIPIIGLAQVEYMLAQFQSAAAIEQQIREGFHYHLLCTGSENSGYFSFKTTAAERVLFVSKLYVAAAARKRGMASEAMAFMEAEAVKAGARLLRLTVNKHNPSILAYEHMGFLKVKDIVTDIGGGYVMDDYQMEKLI